jgi:predicted N-acyltransferase
MKKLELKFVDSITKVGKADWNDLSGIDNPFTRYEFLHALEQAGCTSEATGWKPQHIALYAVEGNNVEGNKKTLEAIMPLYEKNNSYGEYVFDWSWANAYQSYGFDYYPKFVSSVPFTPSVGSRLFVREQENRPELTQFIYDKVTEKAESIGASSWHILFPTPAENKGFEQVGISSRIGSQFHWHNKDYENFEGFLNTLSSRKRKSIRKERQRVKEQNIHFKITEGAEISDQQWDNFIRFYENTYRVRGMQGYLNDRFFQTLSITMPEQLFMITAMQEDREIAAALFFKNTDKLFGRYWGSAQDYQYLHFETCYYQGQEYCIEQGLKSFDSGAQGEHKIQRGFEPIITHSNHWIANGSFKEAISKFLDEEKGYVENYVQQARKLLPYKQN